MSRFARLTLRLAVFALLGIAVLLAPKGSQNTLTAFAKEAKAPTPTFTFTLPPTDIRPDGRPFGLLIDPLRHLTPNSHFFYRTPEGLKALKKLGVKTIVYMVDWNNWKHLYDDYTGEPQTYPSAMTPKEVAGIAKAIGAELIPMVNVTVQCKRADANLPYSSANMKCKSAKAKSSVALVKLLKKELGSQSALLGHVIIGVEPYAGCAYWTNPNGWNCTVGNPAGQHRTSLPAEEYARRINEWATGIHALYPEIKIGAHVRTNTHTCITSCSREWTQVILQDAGANVDFIVVHQYFRLVEPQVTDEATAQRVSYFKNQVDVNLRKIGRTGMPKQMRREVLKWAPANKKEMPIWYGEFNAAYTDKIAGEQAAQIRRALYSGISVGEMYLELLSPTTVKKQKEPGAARAFLHHLFAEQTFIGAYQQQTMIFTPAWHILSALQSFANKEWLLAKGENIPLTATSNRAIVTYAARKNKKVTIALFNHSASEVRKVDLRLPGVTIASAKMRTVGDTASSLLDQNNITNPNLIVQQPPVVLNTQIKPWGLKKVRLAPHSLTVIQVKLP